MNKLLIISCFHILSSIVSAQSFSPAAGQSGSNAIYKDSSIFQAWASGIEVNRGYRFIEDQSAGLASFGSLLDAFGVAEGTSTNVISLGDGGSAILTFDSPIINGAGPDFAVFENSFANNYMELAFVEVSSDGLHFVRFPPISETPAIVQLGPFDYNDCRYVNNLAGNFRQGFGTPFDLEELIDSVGLDVNAITHVKIIDVVGSINSQFGSYDNEGNIINDLYPTNFESGGFDLDAVGVIHSQPMGIEIIESAFSIFPNPTTDCFQIKSENKMDVVIYSFVGQKLTEYHDVFFEEICLKQYNSSIVIIQLTDEKGEVVTKKIRIH